VLKAGTSFQFQKQTEGAFFWEYPWLYWFAVSLIWSKKLQANATFLSHLLLQAQSHPGMESNIMLFAVLGRGKQGKIFGLREGTFKKAC